MIPPNEPQLRAQQGCRAAAALPLLRRRFLGQTAALALAAWGAPSAWAQFRVEVTGVGLQQIPFAIAPFRAPSGLPQDVAAIVAADLVRSGVLRQVPSNAAGLDETARPDLAPWKAQGVDALVTGSVRPLADGRFDVRFRLWDAVRGTDLGGLSYPVGASQLRLAAHRIADYVYEKLTGERGVFSTRIAYVGELGGQFRLWVADADGENAQAALSSSEPIISPAWSPNGQQLAYVSFEARKPVIYAHDLASGRRRLLASFRGSNSAPAWSPDGRRLYATLTLAGSSQIYALDLDGGAPQRITQSGGIDTEPAFAPDGKSVYFVSDRGGAAQIYRMTPDGREVTRVTFEGSYNISPAISPDGRYMAYVTRTAGGFQLRVMDLNTGAVSAPTDTLADESPSFAPNGRLIVYATRVQGREALMTTTLDGRVKTRLATQGQAREPDWGPLQA
ncbi:MAG: Tol-Pal system beta propeller repeat protein TolB [Tepidimonas sp.]|uniref:Tol-Pal system beta propeller repeat protein TolB n=1 Tax=Tepidimonas sp. TaxID=2002775 RepID=UPI00298F08CF|nr:Tol-Pal system beta propeller repeat protein TolB [Tepidimonas sp.]MDW8336306.1 Tol-Pal system beta propeller repeat protein TolB [Tepidimonas sp.]